MDVFSAIIAASATFISDERDGKGITPEMAKMKVLFFKPSPAYRAVVNCILIYSPNQLSTLLVKKLDFSVTISLSNNSCVTCQ